jgi:hypothetical protein
MNIAEDIAAEEMYMIDPALVTPFVTVLKYLAYSPESFDARLNPFKGQDPSDFFVRRDYLSVLATRFYNSRVEKRPSTPKTVPDSVVSLILEKYFDVEPTRLKEIEFEHALSMSAENIVGYLLESYIAHEAEPRGWGWCTGSFVTAIDFVTPLGNGSWSALQIKNRSNTENSSSNKVRKGTQISHWYRTHSNKVETNWKNFPDPELCIVLNEDSFREYVTAYLLRIKEQK